MKKLIIKQIEKNEDEINLSTRIVIQGISISVMAAYSSYASKMSAAFDR